MEHRLRTRRQNVLHRASGTPAREENGKLRAQPLLTLPDVDTTVKLGLMGMTLPPLRLFLGLAMPTPLGWTLVAAGAGVALLRGRARSSISSDKEEPPAPPEKTFA